MNSASKKQDDSCKYSSPGKYLKDVRQKKDVTLKTISQKTRILLSHLKEIENDSFAQLPSKTYLKGFIKSYAKEVGADVSYALKLLDEFFDNNDSDKLPKEKWKIDRLKQEVCDFPSAKKNKRRPSLRITISSIITITLLMVILYFVYQLIHRKPHELLSWDGEEIQKDLKVKILPMKEEVKNVEKDLLLALESETKGLKKKQTDISKGGVKKKEILQEIAKEKTEDNKLKQNKGNNKDQELVKFHNIPTPIFAVVEDSTNTDDSNASLPSNIRKKMLPDKQNVYISATNDDSWITFKTDDKKIKTFTIRKGKALFLQGDDIRIFMGNINATKIFYNNELIKVDAPSGVKSLIFPPSNSRKHKLPLFVRTPDGRVYTSNEYQEKMKVKNP